MSTAPSSPLTIQLTLSGRPLADRAVRLDGVDDDYRTDSSGHIAVELRVGPHRGTVEYDGDALPFELVNAVGLRRIRIDVRADEAALDDPTALASMPADRYVPLSRLGTGSAGIVYKCRDTALDRLVAIKILHEDFSGLPENNEAFVSEGRRLAQVHSPHLIDIYDVGIRSDVAYIVFEYVDGPNLEQLRVTEETLAPSTVAAAGVQLAQALLAIHEAGLLHRDVKPSNGLVDRRGVVKLADFGLAGSMLDLANPQSRVFGTPPFMSPEQLQGKPLGPSSDLYSLGASLYDLATGHPPFYEGDLLLAAMFDEPPDLRVARPDLPSSVASLIHGLLAKAPEKRPDSTDVIDALVELASEAPTSDDQPYLPRLSSQALGVRWLAGPATRRADRYRSLAEGDDEDADTVVATKPAPDEADEADEPPVPEDDDVTKPDHDDDDWADEETSVLSQPELAEPVLKPLPDTGPIARPREYEPTGTRTRLASNRRDQWLSFALGLILGLAFTVAVLTLVG